MINDEVDSLRSQHAISKLSRGGRRYPPPAFTEQGVAMLSSVLRSERAVHVNVAIMRAFDAGVVAVVSLIVAGVGLAASFLPARRAASIHPVEALRCE